MVGQWGSISRARLFYDLNRRELGLVSRYDYVALDEIQTISFPNEEEIQGALKNYLESGEFRVGDQQRTGEAGLILLGNIPTGCMDVNKPMFRELPSVFRESALIDRFHGFIEGWNVPRMRENLRAEGWALNTEYFSEVMHSLREDVRYAGVVDELILISGSSDTRDIKAIKRLATSWLKLLLCCRAWSGGQGGVHQVLFGSCPTNARYYPQAVTPDGQQGIL